MRQLKSTIVTGAVLGRYEYRACGFGDDVSPESGFPLPVSLLGAAEDLKNLDFWETGINKRFCSLSYMHKQKEYVHVPISTFACCRSDYASRVLRLVRPGKWMNKILIYLCIERQNV